MRHRLLRPFSIAAVLGLVLNTAARAQQTVEPLEPDRPDVTNGARIVDQGLLQIEFGGIYLRSGEFDRAFGSPFTARFGVAEWLELRLGNDGILTQVDETGRSTGVGNTQLGAKLRLWARPEGAPLLSVLPTVNLPTASADKGFGSGDADYTLALLTGTDVGPRAHVDVNYGIGAIGAGAGQPHFTQHLFSISGSVSLDEHWNPYLEAFWFSRQDADRGAVTALDTGAVYMVTPRLAIDGGVQVGVTRDAPDVALFAGISVVVGDTQGSRGVRARQRPGHAQRGGNRR